MQQDSNVKHTRKNFQGQEKKKKNHQAIPLIEQSSIYWWKNC